MFLCLFQAWGQKKSVAGPIPKDSRPNILIITADGLGFSDLGCYGSEIRTPHLDALAHNGKLFTSFYSQGVDFQTQAALLTGRQPAEVGMAAPPKRPKDIKMGKPDAGYLMDNYPSLGILHSRKGYHTFVAGKWFVGELANSRPIQMGFHKFFGLIGEADGYFNRLPGALMLSDNKVARLPEEFYITDLYADTTIKYIRQAYSQNQAFLGFVNFTAPNWPIQAPEAKIKAYENIYKNNVRTIAEGRLSRQKAKELVPYHYQLPKKDNPPIDTRTQAAYSACIASLDLAIGRIITSLKELNIYDNTVIIFTSTSGAKGKGYPSFGENESKNPPFAGQKDSFTYLGNTLATLSTTPFQGHEGSFKEGNIRVPLIIKPIGATQKQIVKTPLFTPDLFPFILQNTGVTYPLEHKGQELKPLEGTGLDSIRAETYYGWECLDHKGFIWKGFKWLSNPKGEQELYDLNSDPLETNNLVKAQPAKAARMYQEWKDWAYRLGLYIP